jgi:hypothetical protein
VGREEEGMISTRVTYLALVFVVLLLAGGVLACDVDMGGGAPAKPTIVMTAPTSGAQFQVGEEVDIISSASDPKGVSRVELYVDGQLNRTDPSPDPTGSTEVSMFQTWLAGDPGSHTLSVIAVNVEGEESDSWAVTITVVGEAAGPSASPTLEGGLPVTVTATVEPPPPADTPTLPPPTPTSPPPTATVDPNAPIIKYFRANGEDETYTAIPGETVVLTWEWERVDAGYLDPGNVAMVCPTMPCSFIVVPEGTTTYTLRAINSSATTRASVTVEVK